MKTEGLSNTAATMPHSAKELDSGTLDEQKELDLETLHEQKRTGFRMYSVFLQLQLNGLG
jgi:hypothetical protein